MKNFPSCTIAFDIKQVTYAGKNENAFYVVVYLCFSRSLKNQPKQTVDFRIFEIRGGSALKIVFIKKCSRLFCVFNCKFKFRRKFLMKKTDFN